MVSGWVSGGASGLVLLLLPVVVLGFRGFPAVAIVANVALAGNAAASLVTRHFVVVGPADVAVMSLLMFVVYG